MTAFIPLLIKLLTMLINGAVASNALKKDQAKRYLDDIQAIATQLGTSAVLREQGQTQTDELDQYEQNLPK